MRIAKVVISFVVLMLLSGIAAAQETPRVEVYGGYAYQRLDQGRSGVNANGFDASVAVNLNRWVGIVSDFAFVTKDQGTLFGFFKLDTDQFTYTFGPRVTFRNKTRFTPFAHALFGGAHQRVETNITLNGVNLSSSDDSFAMALGGGMDLRINRILSLRLAQIDYRPTRFGFFGVQDNFQVSTGVVFHFGK